jgi:hypothetical protein
MSHLLWERDNAWLHSSSPGSCRKPGTSAAIRRRLMEIRHFPKVLGPTSELKQCLGEMPWVSRATAKWPDKAYVASARTKVKKASKHSISSLTSRSSIFLFCKRCRHCRRGDRMSRCDFRYWPKADTPNESRNVCFRGNSGHQPDALQCPLLTQSGSGESLLVGAEMFYP